MGGNEEQPSVSKSSEPSKSRPTLSLPPRPSSFTEALFSTNTTPGSFGLGFSPGPMTLVSKYFSDPDSDFKSFSQLLTGALTSPVAASSSIAPPPSPPLFAMSSGLSPLGGFLDSPGFAGLFSPQGPFGMTHQQALAQVTAQAVQVQPNVNVYNQTGHSSPLQSAPEASSVHFPSFSSNSTPQQPLPRPPMPESKIEIKESTDGFHSDQRLQTSSFVVDKPSDDNYNWRKYGQKQVKGGEFPRSYYKCTHPNCPVKKKVERSLDGQVTEIIYRGQHNHQPPQPNKRAKDVGTLAANSNNQENFDLASQFQSRNASNLKDIKEKERGRATSENQSRMSDAETGIDENDQDDPDPKRRNMEVRLTEATSSHRTVTEPRIVVQTTSEVDLLYDGYRWRKYGQKVVKGNPYPRSYYKCTTPGCNVRKLIERAATDPRSVVTTYEGKHNHGVPTPKTSGHTTINSSVSSQTKPNNMEEHVLVNRRDFGGSDQQPVARLRLKEEQITLFNRSEQAKQ